MIIHREGYKLIALSSFFTIFTALAIYWWVPIAHPIKLLLFAGLFVFQVFIIRFFRMPFRGMVPDENMVLSPADGKVVVIEEIDNAEYFGDRRIQVSIFMSPHDIHVNWFPISGIIRYVKYFPGRFLVAWHPKSSLENERTSIVIDAVSGEQILIRQIAGAVARRVVCYAEEGTQAEQGGELGFIKFGSRVDLLLPLKAYIHVSLNQRVRGRETLIASFRETVL